MEGGHGAVIALIVAGRRAKRSRARALSAGMVALTLLVVLLAFG